jgi:hypothetical protein
MLVPLRQSNGGEMKTTYRLVDRAAFALAILCTGLLVYIMVAMPIYKEQVFLERGSITIGGEMVILIGFVFVLIFNIVSLLWMLSRIRRAVRKGGRWVFALGALCLILLLGEKVMVDEIGREYGLGWEVVGEWIILYVFLAIQFFYNIVILRRLYRACVDVGQID